MEKGIKEMEDQAIKTVEDFERELQELNSLLTKARELCVPKVKPSPYMRRWWTTDLGNARKEVAKLARKAYAEGKKGCISHAVHEEHRKAHNLYLQMIKTTKKDHLLGWLEQVDASSIWDIHKFLAAPASDGGKARVPTLRTLGEDDEWIEIDSDEEKAKLMHTTFFPPPPANTQIPENPEYLEPCVELQELTESQVEHAIRKMKPYKAAGKDELSNSIFTHCRDCLVHKLTKIFRAAFKLKYYPKEW